MKLPCLTGECKCAPLAMGSRRSDDPGPRCVY